MFFDYIGQGGKDFIIFCLIVFTFINSIFIINLNSRLEYWQLKSQTASPEEKKTHGPNSMANILALAFIIFVSIVILWALYKLIFKRKLIGR